MSGGTKVLLIEDEEPIRRFLKAALESEGYQLTEATTGKEGIKLATEKSPEIVILDLGLPDQDGQAVLRQLRQWMTVPIIVLSARDQEQQKIAALDGGADDYVTKPFGIGELLARMRTALRHSGKSEPESSVFQADDLKVDFAARLVFRGDEQIHLTPLEYNLLVTLIKNSGKVLTHRFLLREVWGPQDSQETHYLRVFVASLRRKLEKDPTRPRFILTEQGIGYRFTAE